MRRIFHSTVGVLVIVITLLVAIEVLDWFILKRGSQLSFIERNPAGWLLEWPLPVLQDIFPAEKGAMVKLSLAGLIVALLLNVLVYSILVCLILRWREGRSRPR